MEKCKHAENINLKVMYEMSA